MLASVLKVALLVALRPLLAVLPPQGLAQVVGMVPQRRLVRPTPGKSPEQRGQSLPLAP